MRIFSLTLFKPGRIWRRVSPRRLVAGADPDRGFTMVEILVASLVGVILLLAMYLVFSQGMAGLREGDEKITHLYEANRLLAALREDIRYYAGAFVDEQGPPRLFRFEKWAITAGTVTSGAVKKVNTTVEYILEDFERGKRVLRTEKDASNQTIGVEDITYGRGLVKEFNLQQVTDRDATFFRASVEMIETLVSSSGNAPEDAPGKSLKISILILPRKMENTTSIQDHWIDSP